MGLSLCVMALDSYTRNAPGAAAHAELCTSNPLFLSAFVREITNERMKKRDNNNKVGPLYRNNECEQLIKKVSRKKKQKEEQHKIAKHHKCCSTEGVMSRCVDK